MDGKKLELIYGKEGKKYPSYIIASEKVMRHEDTILKFLTRANGIVLYTQRHRLNLTNLIISRFVALGIKEVGSGEIKVINTRTNEELYALIIVLEKHPKFQI